MDTTFDPSARREVEASHRADESGFDSSDQFFQAFKAGYMTERFTSVLPEPNEVTRYIWDKYIDWMNDEGVTT